MVGSRRPQAGARARHGRPGSWRKRLRSEAEARCEGGSTPSTGEAPVCARKRRRACSGKCDEERNRDSDGRPRNWSDIGNMQSRHGFCSHSSLWHRTARTRYPGFCFAVQRATPVTHPSRWPRIPTWGREQARKWPSLCGLFYSCCAGMKTQVLLRKPWAPSRATTPRGFAAPPLTQGTLPQSPSRARRQVPARGDRRSVRIGLWPTPPHA